MNIYKIGFSLLIFLVLSCTNSNDKKILSEGVYRARLVIDQENEIVFNFEVQRDSTLIIKNAEERILVDEISYDNDSIRINFPVFEGYIKAKINDDKNLSGSYIKESLNRVVPFYADYNNSDRYMVIDQAKVDFSGTWKMTFTESDGSIYVGKGIFMQNGNKLTGTIRTETGDYRYLEGSVNGSEAQFSAFDGAHAFLFSLEGTEDEVLGKFYSGNHYVSNFMASKNADFELKDPNTLTYLKSDSDPFNFSFPNEDGDLVSLTDDYFKNKVTVVQIMGTWCPNCLDESKYFAQYSKANPNIAFVALAFEYAKTEELAFKGIKRLKDRLEIDYPILLAQFGTSSKAKAQEKLPMLNHVLSYPTTLIIDKEGLVRRIHTGFNGPATGDQYLEFKTEFESFVSELNNEE
ncbi:MAG: TlpA family protein disulfide reductase [bacterium]